MVESRRNIILDGHDIDNRIVVDRNTQLIQIIKWCDSLHDSSGRVLIITGCSGSGKTLIINGAKKIIEGHSDYLARNGINGPISGFRELLINIVRCDPDNRLRDNAVTLLKEKRLINSSGLSLGAGVFSLGINAGWNVLYHQVANDFWDFLQQTYKESPFVIAFDTSNVESHRHWDIDIKNLIEEASSKSIKLNIILVTKSVPQTQEGIIKYSDIIELARINRNLIEKYIDELCEKHQVQIPKNTLIIDDYLDSGDFRFLNKSLNTIYKTNN